MAVDNADLLKYDFSDGDIIYIASTMFSMCTMKQIARQCSKLKDGANIITLGKPLPCISEDEYTGIYNIYHKEAFLMTWGIETVYFHEKL